MQKKQKIRFRWNLKFLGSFFIPIITLLVIYACIGQMPFGNSSLFTIDLGQQYIPFFSYLSNGIKGISSLGYSFSKAVGGDMTGLLAYYCLSPFNSVFLFFNQSDYGYAILIVTLLKCGCCGVTMNYYLEKKRSSDYSVVFSICYALMAYNIAYQQNIMWLDCVILLPLVVLGIEKIVNENSHLLYIVALFCAVVTNFYIGFMICIFSAIYFLVYLFFLQIENKNYLRTSVKFLVFSLLAIGMSAAVLLPAASSILGNKNEVNFVVNYNFFSRLISIAPKVLFGNFSLDELMEAGLPHIYCSIVTLFFACCYIFNANTSLRKKMGYVLLLACLIVSCASSSLNMLWHGGQNPIWFYYRFSFMISFVLICIGYEGVSVTHDKKVRILTLSFICAIIALFLLKKRSIDSYIAGIISLGIALATMLMMKRSFYKKICLVIVVIELGWNGYYYLEKMEYYDNTVWSAEVVEVQAAVDHVKTLDSGFYRIEKTFQINHNDAMALNYFGINHYSSTEKQFVRTFFLYTGQTFSGAWTDYSATNRPFETLMGIKYILSRYPLDDSYRYVDKVGNILIYENTSAFEIATFMNKNMEEIKLDKNSFSNLQKIYKSLEGSLLFFELENVTIELENLVYEEDTYSVVDSAKDGILTMYFDIPNDKTTVYMDLLLDTVNPITIETSKNSFEYLTLLNRGMLALQKYDTSENNYIKLIIHDNLSSVPEDLGARFYFINDLWFEELTKNVQDQKVHFLSYDDYSVNWYTSKNEEGFLFISVPYEDNWIATIDGENVPIKKTLDTFMGITVPAGNHEIKLVYRVKYQNAGYAISLISLLCVMAISVTKNARRKNVK